MGPPGEQVTGTSRFLQPSSKSFGDQITVKVLGHGEFDTLQYGSEMLNEDEF